MSIVGAGSCNKERPPSLSVSVAVTHDIICTGLILHLFLFSKMTLDLYVYVVLSAGGLFFSAVSRWNLLCGVSLHCAVTLLSGLSSSRVRPSLLSQHTRKVIGRFHDDLCMLHGH